jgi:hypothetical protein
MRVKGEMFPTISRGLKRVHPLFGVVYTAIPNFYHRLKHQRQSNLSLFVLGQLLYFLRHQQAHPRQALVTLLMDLRLRRHNVSESSTCLCFCLSSILPAVPSGKHSVHGHLRRSIAGPKSRRSRERRVANSSAPCEINPFLSQAALRNVVPISVLSQMVEGYLYYCMAPRPSS